MTTTATITNAAPSAGAMAAASSLAAGTGIALPAADASTLAPVNTPQQLLNEASPRSSRPNASAGGAVSEAGSRTSVSATPASASRGRQSLANAAAAAAIPSGARGGGGGGGDLSFLLDPRKRNSRPISSAVAPGPSGCSGTDGRSPRVAENEGNTMPPPAQRVVVGRGARGGGFKRAAGFGGVYRSGGGELGDGLGVVGLGAAAAAAAARYVSTVSATSTLASSGLTAAQGAEVAASRHGGYSSDDGSSGGGDGGQGKGDRGGKNSKEGEEVFLSSLLGMMDPADPKTTRVRGAMMARLRSITTT